MGLGYGIGMGLWQMGWDKWDLGWDLGGMGYGILPSQLIWAASIYVIIQKLTCECIKVNMLIFAYSNINFYIFKC